MRTLRLVVRLAVMSFATLALWLAVVAGAPFAWKFGRLSSWRAAMTSIWSKALAAAMGMRVVETGERPKGGFLLVTNHVSYVDIFLLASRVRCLFVAKADIASWPVMGLIARSAGTVFVDRSSKKDAVRVGRVIHEVIDGGTGIVLFPEGTSTSGAEVAAFRSALLEPAARLELPVRFASIRYRTPEGEAPARDAVCWWGDMTLGPHLMGLLRLPWFEASLTFGEEPVRDSDRKVLADKLRTAVSAHFVPMLPESP